MRVWSCTQVHAGALRVAQGNSGPLVGYMPGFKPPEAGEKAPAPPPREDHVQVHMHM